MLPDRSPRRTRAVTAPARDIDTDGLTGVLVLPLGPLRTKAGEWALPQWSYPDYRALRESSAGMAITGWTRESSQFGVPTPDAPDLPCVATVYVSANYFSTLGVSLARGPGFDPAIDDAPSGEPRVVVSYDFWRSRLSADSEIVGKSVTINGVLHTVVGIAGVDLTEANGLVSATGSFLAQRYPTTNADRGGQPPAEPFRNAAVSPASPRTTSRSSSSPCPRGLPYRGQEQRQGGGQYQVTKAHVVFDGGYRRTAPNLREQRATRRRLTYVKVLPNSSPRADVAAGSPPRQIGVLSVSGTVAA
jgi:hypothetical protein